MDRVWDKDLLCCCQTHKPYCPGLIWNHLSHKVGGLSSKELVQNLHRFSSPSSRLLLLGCCVELHSWYHSDTICWTTPLDNLQYLWDCLGWSTEHNSSPKTDPYRKSSLLCSYHYSGQHKFLNSRSGMSDIICENIVFPLFIARSFYNACKDTKSNRIHYFMCVTYWL